MKQIFKKIYSGIFLLIYIFSINASFFINTNFVIAEDEVDHRIPYEYFTQTEWNGEGTGVAEATTDDLYDSKDDCITAGTSLTATSTGCTLVSRVIDFGESKEFLGTYLDGDKPTDDGTESSRNYFLYVRTGDSTNLDDSSSWTSWHMIGNDFFSNLQNARYLQYKIVFEETGKTINSFEIKYRKSTYSYESVGDRTLYNSGDGNIADPAKLFEYNLGGQLSQSTLLFENSLNSGDYKGLDQVFMVLGGKVVVKDPKTDDVLWTTDVYGIDKIIGVYDLLGTGYPYLVTTTKSPTTVAIFDARGGKTPVWQFTYNSESYGTNYSNVFVEDIDGDNVLDLVATGQYRFYLDIFNFDTGFADDPLDNLKTGEETSGISHHPVMLRDNFINTDEKTIFLVSSLGQTKLSLYNSNGVEYDTSIYNIPVLNSGSWPGRGHYFTYDRTNEEDSIKGMIRVGLPYYASRTIDNFIYDITGQVSYSNTTAPGIDYTYYVPNSFNGEFGSNGLNIMPYSYYDGSTWNTIFYDIGSVEGEISETGSLLSGERMIGVEDLNGDGNDDYITMTDSLLTKSNYGLLHFYISNTSSEFGITETLTTTNSYKVLTFGDREHYIYEGSDSTIENIKLNGLFVLETKLSDGKSELGFYEYSEGTISNLYSRTYDTNLEPTIVSYSDDIDEDNIHVGVGYLDGNVEVINITDTSDITLDYLFTTGGFYNSFPLVTNLNGENIICLPNAVKNINCINGTNAKLSNPPKEIFSIEDTGFDNTRVALGDIDDDNNPEIAYTTYDGSNYYLNLQSISYTGGLFNEKTIDLGGFYPKFGLTFGYFYSHNTGNKYYKDLYANTYDRTNYLSLYDTDLTELYSYYNTTTTGSNHGRLDVYNFDTNGSGFSNIINQYFRWFNGYDGSSLFSAGLDNWQSMVFKAGISDTDENNILHTGSNGRNYRLGNGLTGVGILARGNEYSLKYMQTGQFSSAVAKLDNNSGYVLAVGTADGEVSFNYTNSGSTSLANVFEFGTEFDGTNAGYINQRIKFIDGESYSIYVKDGGSTTAGPYIYTNLNDETDIIDTQEDTTSYDTSTSVKAAADIDGDGEQEFVITDGRGYLYVVNSITGQVEWSYNEGFYIKHLILADVNNDGYLNIVYVTQEGKLVALGNKTLSTPVYVYDGYSQGEDTNLMADQGIVGANWGEVYGATGYNYKVVIESGDTTVDFIGRRNTEDNYFCLVGANYDGTAPDGCETISSNIKYSTQTTYVVMVQAYNSSGVSEINSSDGFSYGTIDISKLVKGPSDTSYKESTEISPGSIVTYKITVQNNWDQDLGGEGVNKLVIYDYMPTSAYYVPNSTRVLNLGLSNPSITDDVLVAEGSELSTDKGAILIWKMPTDIVIEKGEYIDILFNAKFE